MSMIQAFSLLKDVKPYKQGWRVQVKLLHSWRQKTNYGGDTLEMIFADETGVKIHCSARKTLIKKTESKIRLDVVGQVSSLRNIQTVQVAGNDKKKIEFRLIHQLEEHLQQRNNPNMVCMIRFAKIGFYRGDVQITNAFDSSMICFDPDLPECLALKNNMSNDEFALALTDTKNDKRPIKDQIDDWNDVGIKSISEIIMATQEEDCKIICSIESIDTDWSWFIFGHVSRNRFKLHLIVKDDTSTCKLMLLDSVAKVVVGCDAKDIWDGSYEEIEDPDILPQAITDLVGKFICFGLTLGSENVKNGSDIFLVSQVWSGDNILQIESNSEPITHVSSASSIMSGGEKKSEANSSEGSSTPFSKRKEKDQVDQTSTSKKLCTKVVKMEKIKDDELNV
ncbi:BnaC02g24110D [Brassica napus]|uniref:BnaC02g24110D protein n=1 Tax=Brassica napus TaxID=3708 RepID=A0A078G1H1_BRANA|nr:BnaC02g24110D [Brassica napus]